jgi:hypothetical protein
VPRSATGRVFGLPGLLSFACGLAAYQVLKVGGELYLAEICLPVLALGVAFMPGRIPLTRNRVFVTLCIAGCLMLIGYMVSDLAAGTGADRYLRGWSRVFAVVVDMAALTVIASNSRWNLWWFLLGSGISGIATSVAQNVPLAHWKLHYGEPAALLAINAFSMLPNVVSAGMSVAFGAMNIALDYRSAGVFMLVVACVLLIGTKRRGGRSRTRMALKLAVGGAAAAILVVAVLNQTANEYLNRGISNSERREISDLNRFAAIAVGAQAILESPILGYGSWGEGTADFAHDLRKKTQGAMVEMRAQHSIVSGDVFLAHSQLIQAWMEGGVLAGAFFLLYGFYLVREGVFLVFARPLDRFTGIYVYFLISGLWHLFMSPFAGSMRLHVAAVVAVLVLLSHERLASAVATRDERKRSTSPVDRPTASRRPRWNLSARLPG